MFFSNSLAFLMRPLLSLHPAGSCVAGTVFCWVTSFSFSLPVLSLPLVIPGALPMPLKQSVSRADSSYPVKRMAASFWRSHAKVQVFSIFTQTWNSKQHMALQTCNPSIWEFEAGGLLLEFKPNLGYVRPYLKIKQKHRQHQLEMLTVENLPFMGDHWGR